MSRETLSTDHWIEAQPQQPKADIAEYVESEGIPVPRRFVSLGDARQLVANGESIILRSEHPNDYVGASGLSDSYVVDAYTLDAGPKRRREFRVSEVTDDLIDSAGDGRTSAVLNPRAGDSPGHSDVTEMILGDFLKTDPDETVRQLTRIHKLVCPSGYYACLIGEDPGIFEASESFSFWEYKPGTNVAMMADDAVSGRYHVFGKNTDPEQVEWPKYAGGIVETGSDNLDLQNSNLIAGRNQWNTLSFKPGELEKCVELYERVRQLPYFAGEHCPIIELQIDREGQAWFLQYHRSRDFYGEGDALNPDDFSAHEGWVKAEAVRGVLDSSTELGMAMYYPDFYGRDKGPELPSMEDASCDWHWDNTIVDVLSRRRQLFVGTDGSQRAYGLMAEGHNLRTQWLLPTAAMNLGKSVLNDMFGEGFTQKMYEIIYQQDQMARIMIQAQSDGRQGYFRLSPGIEQPQLTTN